MQRERLSEKGVQYYFVTFWLFSAYIIVGTTTIGSNQVLHKCRLCNKEKPATDFRLRGGGRKGLQADCTECTNKRAREYRQQVRNRVGAYKLSKGCECCGFKAEHPCQLDLDHIDPKTKTYKGAHKAYDAGWSWERVERELSLCQVLCKNCHSLRTYKELHWKNEHTTVRMRQSSAQT